jgi:hypothetical protein
MSKRHVSDLIDSLTQEQYDKLGGLVQCNVDRDDMADDVQQALAGLPADTDIYQVKDGNGVIWLFTVSEAEALALIQSLTSQ